MRSQNYRGHLIRADSYLVGGEEVCLVSVSDASSQIMRFQELLQPQDAGGHSAQDQAFVAARAWIDGHPVPWPFIVPTVC
jgi:hypothetical protein